jgi:hypothetical protein
MAPRYYTEKLILSGNVVEVYRYSRPLLLDRHSLRCSGGAGQREQQEHELNEEEKKKYRKSALNRARRNIMRTLNANVDRWFDECGRPYKSKFLTLTFKDHLDVPSAYKEFDLFKRRLVYYFQSETGVKIKLKYLTVIEFQERGSLHFHVVIFNMPYVPHDVLSARWPHGTVWIESVYDTENLGLYLTKSLVNEDDERLKGKKSYSKSQGLHEPKVIIDKKKIETVLSRSLKVDEKDFYNEHLDVIRYEKYLLNPKQKERDIAIISTLDEGATNMTYEHCHVS